MDDSSKPEGSTAFLLGQLVAGQQAMNDKLDTYIKTSKKNDADHDGRLTSLEASRWQTMGAAGVISAILSGLGIWWSGSK